MFYKMIENKCNEWYNSEQCTVHNLIEYIEKSQDKCEMLRLKLSKFICSIKSVVNVSRWSSCSDTAHLTLSI